VCTKSELPANLQNGLVAFYPFCGNASDASGNGFNGTVNGATLTTNRFGTINSAYAFNGNNSHITVNGNARFVSQQMTISAWVLFNQMSSQGLQYLVLGNSTNTAWSCTYRAPANSNNLRRNQGCGLRDHDWAINYSPNTWYHVVYVITDTAIASYVNGTFISSQPSIPFQSGCSSYTLNIGLDAFSVPEYLNGKMDDIAIWERALTSCEVSQMYNYNITPPTIASVPNQTVNAGSQTSVVNFQQSSSNTGYQWMTTNDVTAGSATGVGQNGITFNVTQTGGGMGPHAGMYLGSRFPATYNVPQTATTIKNTAAGVFTATFSQPVTNPLVAFASVGRPDLPVPVIVSRPFTPIWTDNATPGWTTTYDLPNNTFTGSEGFNIIRIDGTFTSVSFNYTVAENYCTVAFGFEDQNVAYSWTNNQPSIGLAASGTGNILPFTAINNTANPIVATITVTPTAGSCVGAPTIFTITVNPSVQVGTISGNQSICVSGTSQFVSSGTSGGAWTSSNAAIAQVNNSGLVTGVSPGTANIIYTVGGSFALKEVIVSPLPVVNAGPDATILSGDRYVMQASGSAGSYLWTPSAGLSNATIINPVATPTTSTNYRLRITSTLGCTATDEMNLTVVSYCLKPMNAFSPNGDGINDRWVVTNGPCTTRSRVQVFNRSGTKVFENSDYKNNWDGTYNNLPLPDGTYYYTITFLLINGNLETRSGNVTIIR
jgi:gliding motility-associated-like protein